MCSVHVTEYIGRREKIRYTTKTFELVSQCRNSLNYDCRSDNVYRGVKAKYALSSIH